ncbi:MAG: GNAT family N-acetyltransferase [Candidatus Bathyarchaeia archaeon]
MKELKVINAKLHLLGDEDIEAIVKIEIHPAVRRWLPGYVSDDFNRELREYRKFFHDLQNNERTEVLVAKIDGRVVGFLALWRMDEYTRSIGVSVHPEYWGRGIATALIKESIEIARKMGVKKVVIETLAENGAMRHVAEKLGFKLESIRKIFVSGSSYNEYVYSLQL